MTSGLASQMTKQETLLFDHLAQFVTDHKKAFMERVLQERTKHITVVLENIYQSQNASAAVRTCECLGLQDIHIVENTAEYQLNVRVLKGADKWLNLHRYRTRGKNNTEDCFRRLREDGYKIFVTDPSPDGLAIDQIDVESAKIALLFGNELNGVSRYALEHADHKVHIPMVGFTESLNISVSVAISIHSLLQKLRASDLNWRLADHEKRRILLEWYKRSVKRADLLEKEFLKTIA